MEFWFMKPGKVPAGSSMEKYSAKDALGAQMAVHCGRPDVGALLDAEIAQLVGDGSRLAVIVCGPGRLADDVRREVVRRIGTQIDAARVELYEESFGW